jgi:hypothetical protein
MMYLQFGEEKFDPDRPKLVLHRNGCDPKRMASLKVKKPEPDRDQTNWVVLNGVNRKNDVMSGWEDNDRFFKYLKDADGTKWDGDAVMRRFTIEEEGRSGVWKQYYYNNNVNTIIPKCLRFRLPDADQGDA